MTEEEKTYAIIRLLVVILLIILLFGIGDWKLYIAILILIIFILWFGCEEPKVTFNSQYYSERKPVSQTKMNIRCRYSATY